MEFNITYEDYMNSSRKFDDVHNCPFAVAVRRQLPHLENVLVGHWSISADNMDEDDFDEINPPFNQRDFTMLIDTQNTFVTKLIGNHEIRL